jgi:hypothetical protein
MAVQTAMLPRPLHLLHSVRETSSYRLQRGHRSSRVLSFAFTVNGIGDMGGEGLKRFGGPGEIRTHDPFHAI